MNGKEDEKDNEYEKTKNEKKTRIINKLSYVSHLDTHAHRPTRLQPSHHQQLLDSLSNLLLTCCIHHRT